MNIELGAAAVDEFVDARHGVVADVALFLTGESEERVAGFLNFWNDRLEREIVVLPPKDKSYFIWKLIDQTMVRVREIERSAVRGSNLLH